MAVKNMSGKIMVLILKNNMAAIADCSKIIDMFHGWPVVKTG